MRDEKQLFTVSNSFANCKKMACQYSLFADPTVGEKPIGSLDGSLILTGKGNASSHPFGQRIHQMT